MQSEKFKMQNLNHLGFKATSKNVIPAKAGIHRFLILLDSRRSLPRTGYGAGVTNWKLLKIPLILTFAFYNLQFAMGYREIRLLSSLVVPVKVGR